MIVYSTVNWGATERKHQSSASLAFMRGIHWWPVKSPHQGPVTRKMFPFDDVILSIGLLPASCWPTVASGTSLVLFLLVAPPKRCVSDVWFIGKKVHGSYFVTCSGLILDLRRANERRRYKVTPSFIAWRKPRTNPGVCISGSTEYVISFSVWK